MNIRQFPSIPKACTLHTTLSALALLCVLGQSSCSRPKPGRPAPRPATPSAASTTFLAVADLPLTEDMVVGVRWSSILFEKPDAMTRAFPDRSVFEVLQPRFQAGGFAFDLPAPAAGLHVFAGLCAGLGDEMCTDPQWKKTETEPLYALGVPVLIPSTAKACTYSTLAAKADACGTSRPLAVSRFLLLYVYRTFSPADDPFMSGKWPWKLPATLTRGFHVIEFRSKEDAREVQVDRLEFNSLGELPNLF